ncbi:hypothetical protein V6N13_037107 [Hibiscus sabdariffa]
MFDLAINTTLDKTLAAYPLSCAPTSLCSGKRNEAARSNTTDRRGIVVAEDSILGQPRAVSAREAILRPQLNRCPVGKGWMGATMRDTQADVPSA